MPESQMNQSTSSCTCYQLFTYLKLFFYWFKFFRFFMARNVRMKDADRISNLPDATIGHILSFLSTKDAVRTSVLSTRWRCLFAVDSNLNFQLDDMLQLPRKRRNLIIKSFESFVDRVLFVHNTTSIEKFCLQCRQDYDSWHFCSWISAAVWRGVQHLDLNIISSNFTALPGILFTCRTLVTLKLDIEFALNVPNYVCFPNLKTLHLNLVEFLNDDSVKRLISGCLSLEDMIMYDCNLTNIKCLNISHHSLKRLTLVNCHSSFVFWLLIDAPVLVYLKYRGSQVAEGYTFVNLQSLVSADIDFFPLISQVPHNATALFEGISEVQSLNLSSTSLKLLSSCVPFPVFPKMVELKICSDTEYSTRGNYSRRKGLADLILRSLPKLEKLSFNQEFISDLPEKVPICLLFKLKAIEISHFEAGKDCIGKAKYFLKNAGVLEKLTIRTRSSLAEEGKLKISDELLASPRKSKQVCIVVV